MTIRVVLLDDHELVREDLRAVLERETGIEVVGEAGTAAEGLRQIEATRPDVALVDLMLPDGDGLDVCRGVKERIPQVACLILTSYSNDDVLLSAIRAEAAGFLLKRTAGTELVRSIRVVADGGSLIDPTLTGRLLECLRTGRIDDGDASMLNDLSPQERRLLDYLSEGLTNRQIAERMNLAEKTVKNYVSNLLRKLNMSSRTEAAVFVTNLRAEKERRSRLVDDAATIA
ncbi:MAG: response regulator transcription factor [Acidimicrobiales bacterium]|jgi:DNA-binding NarL/FixJ family response regulator|nr:response regulator transcription factor [Acidimicrobiales bacterium]